MRLHSLEKVKTFLLRILTDKQKRKIRYVLDTLSNLPVHLFGLKRPLSNLHLELDRMRSRLFHLEGKLRYSALGNSGELSRKLRFAGGDIAPHVKDIWDDQWACRILQQAAGHLSLESLPLTRYVPASRSWPRCFVSGLSKADLNAPHWPYTWTHLSLSSGTLDEKPPQALPSEDERRIRELARDPMLALYNVVQESFDFIYSHCHLHLLSPNERGLFLLMSYQALRKGGTLAVSTPSSKAENFDAYFADPQVLIPTSIAYLERVLKQLPGEVSVHRESQYDILVFRKN